MSVLRIAAKETARSIGLNIPTGLIFVLSIGCVAAIFANAYKPITDPLTESVPWLIQPVAWALAVSLVFVFLFAWKLCKAKQRYAEAEAFIEMAAQNAATLDDQLKTFLRNALDDRHYGIVRCYVFGSVVRPDPTRDVDIIVQFDSSTERRVRICRDRLRDIERRFEESHNLKLHVQTFLLQENEALEDFLARAGLHERIIWR